MNVSAALTHVLCQIGQHKDVLKCVLLVKDVNFIFLRNEKKMCVYIVYIYWSIFKLKSIKVNFNQGYITKFICQNNFYSTDSNKINIWLTFYLYRLLKCQKTLWNSAIIIYILK